MTAPTHCDVVVKVAPDLLNEGNETFTVELSNPTGGLSLGRAVATGTIVDDEASGQSVAITAGSPDRFLGHLRQMFGIRWPRLDHLQGIWRFWEPVYRIPIIIGRLAKKGASSRKLSASSVLRSPFD